MLTPTPRQELANPMNMIAPMMAGQDQGQSNNALLGLLAMNSMGGQSGINPLAVMALQGGGSGGYQNATVDDGDPRRGMFSTGASSPQTYGSSEAYRRAISNIESGSPGGNYQAVGPLTRKGDRAYGRYQVMDFNIGPWTQKVLGRAYTPQEFLRDPGAQDAVFDAIFGGYVQKYGNPQDAASMWFSGRPMAGNNSDDMYTSVPEYIRRFTAGL